MSRQRLAAAVAVALLGVAATAPAQEPDLPRVSRAVEDRARALEPAAAAALERRLEALHDRTGVQAAVLTVRDTAGLPLEDFSLAVAERWGGGAGRSDRGLLVTVVTSTRRARLEVGYGLEEALPDSVAHGVLEAARPDLQRGRFAQGIGSLLDGVEARVRGMTPDASARGTRRTPLSARLPWSYLVVFGLGLGATLLLRRAALPQAAAAVLAAAVTAVLAVLVLGPGLELRLSYGVAAVAGATAGWAFGAAGRQEGRAPWIGLALGAGALLLVLLSPPAPAQATAGDVLSALGWHALAAGALLVVPRLSRSPWMLMEILRLLALAQTGVTYGRGGRMPKPRDWGGSGGGFGGGGASRGW